jgi:hypothetical protein
MNVSVFANNCWGVWMPRWVLTSLHGSWQILMGLDSLDRSCRVPIDYNMNLLVLAESLNMPRHCYIEKSRKSQHFQNVDTLDWGHLWRQWRIPMPNLYFHLFSNYKSTNKNCLSFKATKQSLKEENRKSVTSISFFVW